MCAVKKNALGHNSLTRSCKLPAIFLSKLFHLAIPSLRKFRRYDLRNAVPVLFEEVCGVTLGLQHDHGQQCFVVLSVMPLFVFWCDELPSPYIFPSSLLTFFMQVSR
jgi:hypothetical protein